ncbi:uncharacterized protein CIMG_04513 [Coccidioides immitis RS]|uniref:Uncharacterized protein n=1 Tax=Coccidioides immitis (strain RS) TaxID=246410 RepID=J3KDN1_COCIM|nr:uncharacterized protein CIMG_04513 [Coccidioides immitis RS]EAS33489.3 hypothetical protein CIMG_04513 [Coccidioides immitis RS]
MSRTVLLRLGMRRRLHSLRFKRADEVQRALNLTWASLESWTHPIRLSLLAGSPGERNRRALGGSGQRARPVGCLFLAKIGAKPVLLVTAGYGLCKYGPNPTWPSVIGHALTTYFYLNLHPKVSFLLLPEITVGFCDWVFTCLCPVALGTTR